MSQQQLYHIIFNSKDYYNDDKKIIVNNTKELKQYILNDLENLKYQCPELNKTLKKRPEVKNMYYDDKKGNKHICGKVISFGKKGHLSDDDIENFVDTSYISYWCNRVSKEDLIHFSGFENINGA